jgi:hypothetical protein
MTESTDKTLDVSGTGEPGDTVTVHVGTETQTTTIRDDGTWSVTFPETDLPDDGTYETVVDFDHTDGTHTELDGPTFIIDMTPPEVEVTDGAKSTSDVENAAEYADGVTIAGEGEVGASIVVKVGEHTQTTTVGSDGTWSVTFPTSQIEPGEYEIPFTVTATDAVGNDTVLNDVLVIDTVPHPIAVNPVTADNTVNGAEAAAGFQITGTSTAGASLSVTIQGVTRVVTVGSDGAWSVSYAPGSLTPGEYDATISATTTDAAGNSSTTSHTFRVDTMTTVAFAPMPVATDDIVNATEAAGGVTMTGSAQPGATVQVAWNGATLPATVAADGSWSVTFPSTGIASGTYSTTATVTATDAAGNTATATRSVMVDTETQVSVNPGQSGGDDIVSGSERTSGLSLTGHAEPGATVRVTFEGVTRTVTADGSGNWTAGYSSGEYRAGTYTSTVQVSAADAAGNVATTTHALRIDTEVVPFQRLTIATGADDIVNAVEASGGVMVTGMVEPGSTVMIRFGTSGATVPATVSADGSWSVTIPAGQVPPGESTVAMTITATDAVGNTSVLNENVRVDTIVRNLARTGGDIAGDGTINAAEAAAGVTFSGTVEPNSQVIVRLSNGQEITVSTDSSGLWSATFDESRLPSGEGNATVTILATDPAGNTASISESFHYDTVAPGTPEVLSFSRTGAGLRGIGTALTEDDYSFTAISEGGTTTAIGSSRSDDTFYGETEFRLNETVPDGSYLVINTRDDAGNETSTLLIVDNTTAVDVDLDRAGLSSFDFAAVDLTFAPEAKLTLSAADLQALTGPEQELIVKGDTDDTVTLDHGIATGNTRVIDGNTYDIYTLGTGTVLVDEDVQTNIV